MLRCGAGNRADGVPTLEWRGLAIWPLDGGAGRRGLCDDAGMPDPAIKDAASSASTASSSGLTVLYDGGCPLCRREIDLYRRLPASEPLCFLDVSRPEVSTSDLAPDPLSRETLLARFHVRDAQGQMQSGARAFLALWAVLPGWRWLARVGSLPGMPVVLEWVYQAFLRVRPAMQRVAQWWEARSQGRPSNH